MIYEPAEDSFLLASVLPTFVKHKSVLDMGSGSGILSVTALQQGAMSVLSVDVNPEAVTVCKQQGLAAICSDLFEHVSEKFNVILFNPPYLPLDEDEDEESTRITSGGKEGHELLERFLQDAGSHLHHDGCILVLVSSLTPHLEELFTRYHFTFKVVKEEKIFFETLKVY